MAERHGQWLIDVQNAARSPPNRVLFRAKQPSWRVYLGKELAAPEARLGAILYAFTYLRISTLAIKPIAMKNIIVDEPP